jgi:DNA-binding response OmpR family regulator
MNRSKLRITVTDDNADAANTLALLLSRNGFTVASPLYDPIDGFENILRDRPDVAILDIAMPDIDGYQLARQLRMEADWPLRIVAITGLGKASDKAFAQDAGFDAHFTKPVAWSELEALLDSYLLQPAEASP